MDPMVTGLRVKKQKMFLTSETVQAASITPSCLKYHKNKECHRVYKPVCGDDETTYSNECMLCLLNGERVRIVKEGAC
ncbi:trypsin inhibitor ClTI-1-like [Huso huso]|uniref:Trypsin inhibitor ClTI-1-like n=1 Tax=Huso huso TaxID=61971 RepID=A0ABR1AC71_HUSHU